MFDFDFRQKDPSQKVNNKRIYGQFEPPHYPIKNLKDMPLLMVCGQSDRLCKPGDYHSLHAILKHRNACIGLIETVYGHVSLLNPKEPTEITLNNSGLPIQDPADKAPIPFVADHISYFIDEFMIPFSNKNRHPT